MTTAAARRRRLLVLKVGVVMAVTEKCTAMNSFFLCARLSILHSIHISFLSAAPLFDCSNQFNSMARHGGSNNSFNGELQRRTAVHQPTDGGFEMLRALAINRVP